MVTFKPRTVRSIVASRQLLCFLCSAFLFVLGSAVRAQEHPVATGTQASSVIEHARSSLSAGNQAEAVRILSAHLQTHPVDTSARLLLADAYIIAGQTDQAEKQYQTVLKLAPNNYLALAGLGEMYDRAGAPEQAEPILARAAKASHGMPKVQTEWAAVLARLHRYSDASHALAGVPAPRSHEERLSFHRLKASVAAGVGDAISAASEMEKALALAPDQPGLQVATSAAEIQAKHWERAASLAAPLFNRTHDPGLGMMLLEAQLGTNQDIHPTLDALRTVNLPEQQEVLFRQRSAELLISHERFSESADELKRAVELEPGRTDLNFNLALAQLKASHLDDALATAENLRKTTDSAELEDLIGDIQEARGESLLAVRSYQAAVALAPNEEKYRLSLAVDLIRHKSFAPARAVLKQAEELYPNSWRIQVALGMVAYFAGSPEDATRTLFKAADVAAEPEAALNYLGRVQMDQSGVPDPAALTRLCEYGDAHPNAGRLQFYCAALLFRRDYLSQDRSHSDEILRRLNAAAKSLSNEASPHCQLGKAYRWLDRWQEALRQSETCASMDPNSADAHYRLAQIYQRLGQKQRSEQEMKLYERASVRLADENARRDETIKTFLYSIQNEKRDRN